MKFRFNWKHLLFHFLALWFMAHGFMILGLLENVKVAEVVRHSTNEREILTVLSLSKLSISMSLAYVFGYFIALIFAFIYSNKFKGSWINTLIAFIIFFLLNQFNLTSWVHVKGIFLYPGSFFNGWLYYTINASPMVALGAFFIFGIKLFYNSNDLDKSSTPTFIDESPASPYFL